MNTSRKLINAIISGTNNLKNNKNLVDSLNIFPVPDGDTGTNMFMTMFAACSELEKIKGSELPVLAILDIISSALLRGARGNSGVILSLLFKGFSDGLKKDLKVVDGKQIASAFSLGVKKAYKAVMNPVEGTMLTVAKVACEKGNDASFFNNDVIFVLEAMYSGALKALAETPNLLPVLKKAKVVDAGGKGLCLILEGILSVFKNNFVIKENLETPDANSDTALKNNSIFSDPSISNFSHLNIKFTYCTEFIVKKEKNNVLPIDPMNEYFKTIGDCVVVVEDDEIIKVHMHTNNPGLALEEGIKYGEFLKVKIENMKEQNRAALESKANFEKELKESALLSPVSPSENYGFVAVALGDGIVSLFKDLGCNHVVSGGQTMNPSTEDIAKAVLATPARTVFILPNNKNIFLAAEQATSIVKDRNIKIIPSRTIPQGICAMLAFNEEKQDNENFLAMSNSTKKVKTGQITFASRDAEFGGFKIKKGDILALIDGKLVCKSKLINKAVFRLLHAMVTKRTEFVTVIYGSSVSSSDAETLFGNIQSRLGSKIEVSLVNGGQPVYHYIISVE